MTLAYMVNTSQYEKYLKKNHIDYDSKFNKDIRFYRKRIISLTKDLFKNQIETDKNNKNENVDVAMTSAFNMYMRACISYLKFSDQSETIQKCYVCLGITDDDDDQNKKCVCKIINENDLFEFNKANELCFKPKEVKKITLDNYVIRKNVKKSEPIVYPQKFTFNPRDPAFKHKGLKPKAQSIKSHTTDARVDTNIKVDAHINEDLKNNRSIPIQNRDDGENREKIIKDSPRNFIEKNENENENKKNKKNKKDKKKVSFNITNYIDNI
jgi:hypothetical protein